MTRKRQKQFEILYTESLAKKMGYDWKVVTPPDEQDWPDLLIETSNDMFGLEVRDMYVDESRKGSVEKRDESFRNDLLSELSVKYYEKKNVPIRLDICGSFYKDSVEKILEYLLSAEFQEGVIIKHDIIINGKKTRLFVERLSSDFRHYNYWKYMDDNRGWVERINEDKIEMIIKEKSLNIDKYKKNVSNVSLLIVANRVYNSGKLLLEESRKINTFGFDKVFFYMHPLDAVVYNSD